MKFKQIAKADNYRLYTVDGTHELWYGNIASKFSFKLGYVSDSKNFLEAVNNAKEEIANLMIEAGVKC